MRTITDDIRGYVDATDLVCPGCGELVCPDRPAHGGGEWSHRDGTALCCYLDGTPAEPVETR